MTKYLHTLLDKKINLVIIYPNNMNTYVLWWFVKVEKIKLTARDNKYIIVPIFL